MPDEIVGSRLKARGQLASSWYRNNYLLANPDKFQSLNINPRNVDAGSEDAIVRIDDQDAVRTGQIKLLGIHIDENLNFSSHISHLCIKASQKVAITQSYTKCRKTSRPCYPT